MRAALLAIVLAGSWLIDLSAGRVWRSEETLWRQAATLAPNNVRSTGNQARALFARGDGP